MTKKKKSCSFEVEKNIPQVSWGPQVTVCSPSVTLLHQNVEHFVILPDNNSFAKEHRVLGSLSEVNEGSQEKKKKLWVVIDSPTAP